MRTNEIVMHGKTKARDENQNCRRNDSLRLLTIQMLDIGLRLTENGASITTSVSWQFNNKRGAGSYACGSAVKILNIVVVDSSWGGLMRTNLYMTMAPGKRQWHERQQLGVSKQNRHRMSEMMCILHAYVNQRYRVWRRKSRLVKDAQSWHGQIQNYNIHTWFKTVGYRSAQQAQHSWLNRRAQPNHFKSSDRTNDCSASVGIQRQMLMPANTYE